MICPKCGYNVPEGPECPACGVIMDKFARRSSAPGHATGPGGFHTPAILPQGHRAPTTRRKPVGKGLVLGAIFLFFAIGGVIAWDLISHYMQGKRIYKAMLAAVNPAKYGKTRMTGDDVYRTLMNAVHKDKLKLNRDQVYVRIEGSNSATGELVHLTIEVLVPHKLLGLIKYPVYKKIKTRFTSTYLPNGYQHYETDPDSKIARALQAIR